MFLCLNIPYIKYQPLNCSTYLAINIWIWNRHSIKLNEAKSVKFAVTSRLMIGSGSAIRCTYIDTFLLYSVVIFGFFTSRISHSRLHAVNVRLPHHDVSMRLKRRLNTALFKPLYFRYGFFKLYFFNAMGN